MNSKRYSSHHAWIAVGVLVAGSIVAFIDRLILGFLLDPIKADLNLSDTELGIVSGLAFTLFYVLMGIPIGLMLDRFSRKKVIGTCITIWSVMTSVCGLATSFVWLFLARAGVGVGEAVINPGAVSMISDAFPPEKVVEPLSIYTLGFYFGGGMAIVMGGYLVAYFSSLDSITFWGYQNISAWRLVFLMMGLPGLLVALLMLVGVKEPPRREFSIASEDGGESGQGIRAFLRGQWKLYLFLYLAQASFGFWIYSVLAWFPAMLMRTYKLAPDQVALGYGIIFIVAGVAGALSVSPYVNRLVARGIKEAPVVLSMQAMVMMAVPAILAPLMPSAALCLGLFSICMYGLALTTTASYTCIAWITPSRMTGVMTSLFMIIMNVTGGSTAAIVVGSLSDNVFGPENIRYSFVVVAAVSIPLAAILFGLLRPLYRAKLAK